MTADGYIENETMQKYLEMQDLFDHQVKLNKELVDVSEELKLIPEMPKDLEKWIDSIPNEKSKFKLSDYAKLFKVGRKYDKLAEKREENAQKIKVLVIDNLIDRINEILRK
jgi:hypothetical protein